MHLEEAIDCAGLVLVEICEQSSRRLYILIQGVGSECILQYAS